MSVEREVKLGVWPGFVLPDLHEVWHDVEARPVDEQHLVAVYYDTEDLRLMRSGVTLRYRSGDDETGWTLKLPSSSPTVVGGLSRSELVVRAEPESVPDEIRELVAARVRTAALIPVARLETRRRPVDLVDANDQTRLLQVVDDEVSVIDAGRVALRFREIEAELVDGPIELLDAVVAALRSAGAGAPDPTPKVARAMGPRAFDPPELTVRSLGPASSAAEVLTAGLARAATRLLDHDPLLRTTDDDVETVHRARVATRRMRSDLRTYAELLDPGWAVPLREELGWLADVLGAVRDADVLRLRLVARLQELDPQDEAAGRQLLHHLDGQLAGHRAALRHELRSDRYLALLDRVVEAGTRPVVQARADQPAAIVLPALAAGPWSALAKAARRARRSSPDEVLHRIRIHAKRARYAADVAALVVGKRATRLAEAVASVQEVLGEHQDAVTARGWLREAAATAAPDVALVAGQLMERERQLAQASRAGWPEAWRIASQGKLRTWLNG